MRIKQQQIEKLARVVIAKPLAWAIYACGLIGPYGKGHPLGGQVAHLEMEGRHMGKMILMEEFHVTVHAPGRLPSTELQTIHKTLSRDRFRLRLRQAIRTFLGKYPSLKNVRVKLSK